MRIQRRRHRGVPFFVSGAIRRLFTWRSRYSASTIVRKAGCGPRLSVRERAGFQSEPPLSLEKRDERLLLDDAAHAAVERRIPDDARKR
jgi:hypothetical protein